MKWECATCGTRGSALPLANVAEGAIVEGAVRILVEERRVRYRHDGRWESKRVWADRQPACCGLLSLLSREVRFLDVRSMGCERNSEETNALNGEAAAPRQPPAGKQHYTNTESTLLPRVKEAEKLVDAGTPDALSAL